MNIIKILIVFKYKYPTIVRYGVVIRFRKNVLYEIVLYERRNWREDSIGLTTKWLRVLSIPPNDKIRNHLVANPIVGGNNKQKYVGIICS